MGCRGLLEPAGRNLPGTDVNQAIQECSGGDDHLRALQLLSGKQLQSAHAVSFRNQLNPDAFYERQVWSPVQQFAHHGPVLLLIRLATGRPHGSSLAAVQNTELNSCAVRHHTHDAAQGIDLHHQLALRNSTDRRVARHLPDRRQGHGDERSAGSAARASGTAASQPACPPPMTITSNRCMITCRYKSSRKYAGKYHRW